ncbi:MAG: hypothetical protein ACXV79_10710 [Methylobacter sp.]
MSGLQNLFGAVDKFISPTTTKVFDSMLGFSPVAKYVDRNIPIAHQFGSWAKSHPAEFGVLSLGVASGLGAAGFLGGGGALAGAGAGAFGDAALSAAPAASTAGGMGGLGGMAGASSAITPTFASGLGAAPVAGGALMSGTGTLGAAGTAAGLSSITPYFASTGAAAPATGLFGNMTTMDKINNFKSILNFANSSANNNQNTNYATYSPNYAAYKQNNNLGIYGY